MRNAVQGVVARCQDSGTAGPPAVAAAYDVRSAHLRMDGGARG
jgi:hypothetical protein